MDNGLLYTNRFTAAQEPNTYSMGPELRNSRLLQHVEESKAPPREQIIVDANILKTNRVITDEGEPRELEQRAIIKEKRTILSINSNQRRFFEEKALEDTSPNDFKSFISQTNFPRFEELYNIALNTSSTIQTFEEYTRDNPIDPASMVMGSTPTRSLIRSLIFERSFPLGQSAGNDVSTVNNTLLDILANILAADGILLDNARIANELNVLVMTGAAYNRSNYWRPFRFTNETGSSGFKMITYKEQHPNNYTVVLPRIINHVKSIRLISTEIPNTINNITERNNLIILRIRTKQSATVTTPVPVALNPSLSLFNFILVKLEVGSYTTEELITHMESQMNTEVKRLTCKNYGNLFKITWNKNNGEISIISNRPELEFHLKFYSEMSDIVDIYNPTDSSELLGKSHGTVTNFSHDLWYMLGFPWPYEIGTDGTDNYTQKLTNITNFGLHSVFDTSKTYATDIFQRDKEQASDDVKTYTETISDELHLSSDKHSVINTYRAYRYPHIEYKYIYLVLKGYKCIDHVNQHNSVISFTDNDIFAKVLLNVGTGQVAYDTFVSNPLVFTNVIDKIELLEIQWIDERGALVDFNDVDHSFTLELIHYVTQVDVNQYNSTLGTIDRKSYPDYLSAKASN